MKLFSENKKENSASNLKDMMKLYLIQVIYKFLLHKIFILSNSRTLNFFHCTLPGWGGKKYPFFFTVLCPAGEVKNEPEGVTSMKIVQNNTNELNDKFFNDVFF